MDPAGMCADLIVWVVWKVISFCCFSVVVIAVNVFWLSESVDGGMTVSTGPELSLIGVTGSVVNESADQVDVSGSARVSNNKSVTVSWRVAEGLFERFMSCEIKLYGVTASL